MAARNLRPQSTFQECVARVTNFPDNFAIFVTGFNSVVPALAAMLDQFLDFKNQPDLTAVAHTFHYIIAGLTFLQRLVAEPHSDFVLIPMEDAEMEQLVARVEGMEWDAHAFQSMLFDYGRNYDHTQVWSLANAAVASNRRTKRERRERRNLAFMLGTSRDTEERPNFSLVQSLDPDIARHIAQLSLAD